MKFGKELQSQRIPGWATYYVDYKGLKKLINNLSTLPSNSPTASASENDLISQSPISQPPVSSATTLPAAPFFFKVERELDKINHFYALKQSDLQMRLRTLVEKRKVLARGRRGVRISRENSGWFALYEGFKNFERDLARFQKYIDLNAIAFRKILKKFDKRSRSSTKELYLARQVEVQPAFNREELTKLNDIAAANIAELERLLEKDGLEDGSRETPLMDDDPTHHDSIFFDSHSLDSENELEDIETTLVEAVRGDDPSVVKEVLTHLSEVAEKVQDSKNQVQRILWKAAMEEPTEHVPNLHLIPVELLDFAFIEDINNRTTLHLAANAGHLGLVQLCLSEIHQVPLAASDAYGRTALHYASMKGFDAILELLLERGADPHSMDFDGYSSIIYAITNGRTSCIRALLNKNISFIPRDPADPNPLSLACQCGHEDIVELLLDSGVPLALNHEGLYPQHIAARQGHVKVLELLISKRGPAKIVDVPDKYQNWTPLFHASSEGRPDCVRALIQAGANLNLLDETRKTAIHYAAWKSNIDSLNILLLAHPNEAVLKNKHLDISVDEVSPPDAHQVSDATASTGSRGFEQMDMEPDNIPSLFLPPPIIPFRIYGHNYLEKKALVQLTLGHPNTTPFPHAPPIRFYSQSSEIFSLKLVMTFRPDPLSIPHSVIIPLEDAREVFDFHVSLPDEVWLEFDVYPAFGSKIIGKAIALPNSFTQVMNHKSFVVPFMDSHMKAIGEISFELSMVRPFHGIPLGMGGRIETYWKSTKALTSGTGRGDLVLRSPNMASVITSSSLHGEYIEVIIQVTADDVPVAYPLWELPIDVVNVQVADVTLEQFLQLAKTTKTEFSTDNIQDKGDAKEWWKTIRASLVPLKDLIDALPSAFGLNLQLRYPTKSDVARLKLRNTLELNSLVDSVLAVVYQSLSDDKKSRELMFSSFNPLICTALNWKQPNYPVFFATHCGLSRSSPPGEMLPANRLEIDRRCTSIKEAVKFAKSNNLLGVILDETIIMRVPSLIESIKEQGLLVATFGPTKTADVIDTDADMVDGVFVWKTAKDL